MSRKVWSNHGGRYYNEYLPLSTTDIFIKAYLNFLTILCSEQALTHRKLNSRDPFPPLSLSDNLVMDDCLKNVAGGFPQECGHTEHGSDLVYWATQPRGRDKEGGHYISHSVPYSQEFSKHLLSVRLRTSWIRTVQFFLSWSKLVPWIKKAYGKNYIFCKIHIPTLVELLCSFTCSGSLDNSLAILYIRFQYAFLN